MSEKAQPLTVLGASLDGETVGLRCEGGAIAALGPGVGPQPGDVTIEAGGAPLVPPLLNGHTHAAMTLFRGFGDDLPLMRWLEEKIWPIEGRLTAEDVYWGARLACVEMIRSGTTRFWDMYWLPAATGRAVRDAGLRATIGGPLFDAAGDGDGIRARALADLDELAELEADGVDRALTPHAIYTASEELLRWAVEQAAEHDAPLHIHLSETAREVEDCVEAHGVRPAAYLDGIGFLGERTLLAHGVHLDQGELELIAARGSTVVTNPVANMKLAVGGVFPYPAARRACVSVGLGTDGAGSNNSLDLLSDAKAFALLQKQAASDPTVAGAAEAWQIATGRCSALLGAQPLAPGAPADFLLLSPGASELAFGSLEAALVYAASGSIVDTTVVAGRVLMRGGEVPGSDEVTARALECARRLGIR